MNSDTPIAFFLTWVTYGTWLPGDARGWVEYKHGWQLPRGNLEADCTSRMSEDAIRLTNDQRRAVESQIKETCQHRGWILHAVNCRSNHIHVLVSAGNAPPKKIRIDLKAYATRCLNALDPIRDNWWAERGSIRWDTPKTTLKRQLFMSLIDNTGNPKRKRGTTQETRSVSEGQHRKPEA